MENPIILPQRKVSFFLQVTGFIFFATLFCMAWHFYLGRMLSSGGAFNVFQFIQTGSMVSFPERYGDYLPELLPFLAFKMGFSLRSILIIYSISFILFHYLIFLFITLVLKNNGAGIALLLASCLSYYYAFYMPTMELHDDIPFAVLLWAIIHPEYPYSRKQEYSAVCGAIVTIVLMSFFHPMGIVLAGFVLGLEIIGSKRYNDNLLWLTIGIGMCWYVLEYYILTERTYEQELFMPFDKVTSHLIAVRHWLSTKYFDNLTYLHFSRLKWIGVILLLLSLRKGIITFLFLVGFIFVASLMFLSNFRDGASPAIFENYYAVYGFFMAIIFVFLFYKPRRKNLVTLLAIPFLWNGVSKIHHAHDFPTNKVSYIDRIVKNMRENGEKKCIIDSKCYPYDLAWDSWDIAFESLVYSSLNGPDSSATAFIKILGFERMCDSVQNIQGVFLGVRSMPNWYSTSQIPNKYFKLPATGYKYLTHSQDDSSFHENIFSADNVKIVPLKLSAVSKSNNWIIAIPLKITNSTGKMIPAIPRMLNAVYISYDLYDDKGKPIEKSRKEPLETDINASTIEGLIIYCPHEKGTYYVQPDIITDGKRSWNIPSPRIKVIVE